MTDDIDRLLAELKAKHNQETPVASQNPPVSQADPHSSATMSLDALLNQLTDSTKRAVRTQLSQQMPRSPQPAPFPAAISTSVVPSPMVPDVPMLPELAPPADPLLSQMKAEHEAMERLARQRQERQQREAAARQQREAAAKQRRLEALRAQRRAELTEQATAWLKALKPRSEEGKWFEEFACNYESRLEAALDYLEALQAVERESRGV